jgi:hypothetical protein
MLLLYLACIFDMSCQVVLADVAAHSDVYVVDEQRLEHSSKAKLDKRKRLSEEGLVFHILQIRSGIP